MLLVSSSIFEISRHVFLGLRIAVLPPFFFLLPIAALFLLPIAVLFLLPIAVLPPFFRFRSGRHYRLQDSLPFSVSGPGAILSRGIAFFNFADKTYNI